MGVWRSHHKGFDDESYIMYSDSSSLLENAKAYSQLGFSLFPCHSRDDSGNCTCGKSDCRDIAKHPLTQSGFKDATTNESKLSQYFSGDFAKANIAIATGDPSGVSVIDVDDIGSLSQLESLHGSLPITWTAQTGSGGKHYYFRHDERWKNVKNSQKFAGGLDVRTTGGYVLLPPSLHKTGNRYQWLKSPTDCELATAPDWLLTLLPKRNEPKNGSKNVAESTTPRSGNDSTTFINDSDDPQSITIERAKSLYDRAVLFLKKTPIAIEGEGGHAQTFSVACRICELFGSLSDDELFDALQTWNERCSPPWKDSELRHKLNDARNKIPASTVVEHDVEPLNDNEELPSLDNAAFTGIIGEIAKAIEPETEADIAGVIVTLLTCCGNVLGKSFSVPVGPGVHHANLFACLVGDTASGKGQAWDVANYLMERVDKTWTTTNIAYGLSSGEGLVERLADPINDDGSLTITIPPETQLLCFESEFARPITAMRREGNTLSPLLRNAWDGKPMEVMTRGKSKLRASNAFVSIIAHVTREELVKLFSGSVDVANGFSNRFLWSLVRSSKALPHGGNITVLNRFVPRLKEIFAAHAQRVLVRSPEADRLWETVYEELKSSKAGAYGKAVERARPQVVRLSLIYAALDCSPTIQPHHLNAALAVWRYCDDSARNIFGGVIDHSSGNKLERRLQDIVKSESGITKGELRLKVSHSITTDRFDAALQRLIERNEIVSVYAVSESGRNVECFYTGVERQREIGNSGKSGSHEVPLTPTTNVNSQVPEFPSPAESKPQPANFPNSRVPTPSHNSNVQAATLSELFEWRNGNSIEFVCRDGDGIVWVTNEQTHLLTPAIEQAILSNQAIVSKMVRTPQPIPQPIPQPVVVESEIIPDDEFFEALRTMR